MSDILTYLYNACDPFDPASAAFYVDCSQARGDNALTERVQENLRLSQKPMKFLVSGHIGCGKSSELLCLKRALENPQPKVGHKRYFTIVLDAEEYLDDFDVEPTDILLAIVAELGTSLRKVGIELKDSYFQKRIDEVERLLLRDVEMEEGEIELGKAKFKIALLKKDPEARQKVREYLLPRMTTMLEEINLVFTRARLKVQEIKVSNGEQPFDDIVLILDSLEKIQRVGDFGEGAASHRELFIERAPQLIGLGTHVIYTIPLSLARSESQQLKQRYGSDPMVLPMVKIFRRGTHESYPLGLQFLRELLEHRLNGAKLEEVFEADALEFLLKNSGGHVRNLMLFVREACTFTEQIPIRLRAAHQAISQTVSGYAVGIPETNWEKLVLLEKSDDQQIPNDDPDYSRMLENLSVLEYINGDGADDPFSSVTPWYAVNPIVRQLPKFKKTAQRLNSPNV